MDRDALWNEVLEVHRAGPSLPARRARDDAKAEAAEIRNYTAWQRLVWAVDGLQALLLLRDELRLRKGSQERELAEAGGLVDGPLELSQEIALRQTQVREVLAAFLSQGKVLLDLLAQAVVAALGNPGRFDEKHDSRGVGVRLDEFASGLGVVAPNGEVVERARSLDRGIAGVRDHLIVHPKLSGEHRRLFVQSSGHDLLIGTLFPEDEKRGRETGRHQSSRSTNSPPSSLVTRPISPGGSLPR